MLQRKRGDKIRRFALIYDFMTIDAVYKQFIDVKNKMRISGSEKRFNGFIQ